jgi:SAM-dependent methyltransferase
MRKIHDDPDYGVALGRRGRDAVLAAGSIERAAAFVRERVSHAMDELEQNPQRFTARGPGSAGGALQRARDLIRSPQNLETPSRMPFGVARKLRLAVNRLLTHHDEQVNQRLEALADAVAAMGAESIGTAVQQVEALRETTTSKLDGISMRLQSVNTRNELLEAEMVARPYVSDPELLLHLDEFGRPQLAVSAADNEGSYRGFEDTFRGSEAFVADRMLPYLGVLRDKAPVLDVGCGRGELLGLLSAIDVAASGVDLDASMLERCRAKGLDVALGDAVDVLDSREVGSLGAVTSFQVVEHLELATLRKLFEAAHRALRPGGVLVAETVNPHSPGALKTFWLDLTHVRPLYPEAMLFLALESGFQEARILFPQGVGNLDNDLRVCGEYALIATKT